MELCLTLPDDCHVHLRDGADLASVVPDTARRFARAVVMPNLRSPVITTEQAGSYRRRILAALPHNNRFEPLMALYLTDNTPTAEVERAHASGFVCGFKYYPAGATTNSDQGVTQIENIYPLLAAMEQAGMPLLVHGEVTDPAVDIFDREAVFIERILTPLLGRFPALPIVFEHITSRLAVSFVEEGPATLAATVTVHHLLDNRNSLFVGGIRPHQYCLPVLKREDDRQALIKAATSGNPKFFLGTDSAPHARTAKEATCGCAGIYTAHAAMELYAEVFEQAGALSRLEAFASHFGADFYDLPRNTDKVMLVKENWTVPDELPFGSGMLYPYRAGQICQWRIKESVRL